MSPIHVSPLPLTRPEVQQLLESELGHVWTAPRQDLSDVAASVGCGHVSGLLMRQVWPLALMLCADRVPNKSARFGIGALTQRVLPSPGTTVSALRHHALANWCCCRSICRRASCRQRVLGLTEIAALGISSRKISIRFAMKCLARRSQDPSRCHPDATDFGRGRLPRDRIQPRIQSEWSPLPISGLGLPAGWGQRADRA
jgi:hypothetical protein